MDKVSIIIPVYNGEKYLQKCIESLINQTYKNIEIIFLNDGSIDNSIKILQKYQKKDKRITLINKENTGVSDTRNIGISKATGKYICFCDCDDEYSPNYIELMHNTAVKFNVDVVKCNYKVVDSSNNPISSGDISDISNKKYNSKEIKEIIIPRLLNGNIPCFSHLIMIKKDALNSKFPLNIAMMEDVVFYLNLFSKINSLYILYNQLYTIMYNEEGATNNIKNYERNIKNIITVNQYIKDILKDNQLNSINNIESLNINTLNSISDFIFRHYLYNKDDTIQMIKNIQSNHLSSIINSTNLKKINIQRRIIIILVQKNKYLLLKIYFILRKIIYKLKRR